MNKTNLILLILIPCLITISDSMLIGVAGSIAALLIGLYSIYQIQAKQDIATTEAEQDDMSDEKQITANLILDYTSKSLLVHNEQISDVIASTEETVLTLGERFSNILDRMTKSVSVSAHIKEQLVSSGQNGLIARLHNDEDIIKRLDDCINLQVDKSAKLLKEFAVVANEASELSKQLSSTECSNLVNFERVMTEFEKNITAFVNEDVKTFEMFRMQIQTIARDISKDVVDLDAMLSELVADTESVQLSISDILVSLQFQDSMRQILEHVQEDLTKISEEIESLDILLSDDDQKKSLELEENIIKKFTMKSEHQAYLRATSKNSADTNKQTSKEKGTLGKQETVAEEDDEITFL